VRDLVAGSLRFQLSFAREWYGALRDGRSFESQLTDEFGFNPTLQQSRRRLLQAYAELRALLPDEKSSVHRAFRDHLRRMDFH
jgi:hypothetical protein